LTALGKLHCRHNCSYDAIGSKLLGPAVDGTIDANLLKSFKKGEKMATSNVATFDNPMDIFLNSNLSEKMKARLSFGGSPLQEEECQLPEDQESINNNSQDDVPSNK
jgi:hypothetical protein